MHGIGTGLFKPFEMIFGSFGAVLDEVLDEVHIRFHSHLRSVMGIGTE